MKRKSVYYLLLVAACTVALTGCNSKKAVEVVEEQQAEVVEEVSEATETENAEANEAETVEASEETVADSELSEEVTAALNDLYAIQINYSNGTAPLNIIPTTTVETVYDNWDAIAESGLAEAPISLREYVDPSIVYLDYETDYSIKWNKDENDVTVEETNVEEREDYKQKEHK